MKQEQKPHSNVLHPWRNALRAAFPHTIPILTGFLFLGISYGIYMYTLGFAFWYPMLMFRRICRGQSASRSFSAVARIGAHAHTQWTSFVLWHRYALSLSEYGKEKIISDLWPLR